MKVAVIGYGTVGSGVVNVIETHKDIISQNANGEKIDIDKILVLRDFPNDPYSNLLTKDFNDILNDNDIKIVVEAIGGINPAFEYTMKLLNAGKSVVTSNKELVAFKGLELLKTAQKNGVNYLFEAAVGGGIPIISPIYQCLVANKIDKIIGILNGTTNFILTMMFENGMSFEKALKIAQDKGYAEKDPSADIDGYDTARKICILASLVSGKQVYPFQVETEGIRNITVEDFSYIKSINGSIKLLGEFQYVNEKIVVFVGPAIIFNNTSQLARVNDVFNAILVHGDVVGELCFYGQGAGKFPTASAVVSDIVECTKNTININNWIWNEGNDNFVIDYKSTIKMPFYVRAKSNNQNITEKFNKVKFLSRNDQPIDEVAFITNPMTFYQLKDKLENIEVINIIRIVNSEDK